MDVTYIEYLMPGLLFAESSVVPAPSGVPDCAVGWRTFTRTEIQQGGEVLKGERRDVSSWTYRGREMTMEDVEREMPDSRILISNMQGNGWDRVVRIVNGHVYPLLDDDVVVES